MGAESSDRWGLVLTMISKNQYEFLRYNGFHTLGWYAQLIALQILENQDFSQANNCCADATHAQKIVSHSASLRIMSTQNTFSPILSGLN